MLSVLYAHCLRIYTFDVCLHAAFFALVRGLYQTSVTHPSYNVSGQYTAPVLLFAFAIGLTSSECHIITTKSPGLSHCPALTIAASIEAGVSTMYVSPVTRSKLKD